MQCHWWRVCNSVVHEEPFGVLLLLRWVLVPEIAGVAMPRIVVEAYSGVYV